MSSPPIPLQPPLTATLITRYFPSPAISRAYATKVDKAFHIIDGARSHLIELAKRVAHGALGHTTCLEVDGFRVVDVQGEVIERVYLERVRMDGCLVERIDLEFLEGGERERGDGVMG